MDSISLVFIFILGAIIGSFVNVIAYRYNTGLSIYNGRSKCFTCSKILSWKELIPVLSFIFLRGRCKGCKGKISFQYPFVEIALGVVFVLVAIRQYSLWEIYSGFDNGLLYSILFFVYYCFIFSLLFVIALYDFRHKIIPNKLVYIFIALSTLKLLFFFFCKHKMEAGYSLIDFLNLVSPLALFSPIALLWLLSGGRWIGFGDAKLAFGMGALLGFVQGISALMISFWVGAIYGLVMIFLGKFSIDPRKRLSMGSEVPFAPFMIVGTIIAFFIKVDLLGISLFINMN